MSSKRFKVKWQAEDGYMTGKRPQLFEINENDIDPDATDGELEELFDSMLQAEFENRVTYYAENREAALTWMREQRDAQKENDQ